MPSGNRARLGCLWLLLGLGACSPPSPARQVADDQDITRDILWEFRKDVRLADVRVTCVDRTVTLEGSVPDRPARDEALRLAAQNSSGARINSSLIIRQR